MKNVWINVSVIINNVVVFAVQAAESKNYSIPVQETAAIILKNVRLHVLFNHEQNIIEWKKSLNTDKYIRRVLKNTKRVFNLKNYPAY